MCPVPCIMLATMDIQYLGNAICADYLQKTTQHVDHLYTQLFRCYFPITHFGVEQEPKVFGIQHLDKNNIAIRYSEESDHV